MSATDARHTFDQALHLCQVGSYVEAERICRALADAHPDSADAWNLLAVVLGQQNLLEGADKASERATQLSPTIAPYWLTRGNVQLALGQLDPARKSFSRAVEIAPGFAEAHYRLGLAFHRDLRFEEAAGAYRTALRYAPDVAEIYSHLAAALIKVGRLEEAMHAYQEAFARDRGGVLDRSEWLEWLSRLHFDALPDAAHRELERFFARDGIDHQPYVRAGLKALCTLPDFRRVLAWANGEESRLVPDDALWATLSNPLLQSLLRDCLVPDVRFERLLSRVRASLLTSRTARERAALDFLCALALQNHNNEFVHAHDAQEQTALHALVSAVERRLEAGTLPDNRAWRDLMVAGSYQRLSDLRGIDAFLAVEPPSIDAKRLLERSVIHPRVERALRGCIPSDEESGDPVSQSVRSMYEEHPYPRWFAIDREPPMKFAQWLARELPALPPLAAPDAPEVLVAGCGTGYDAIWLASNIEGAQVLGIDLSLASLSYGTRMAQTLHVDNLRFERRDILRLPELDRRFDLITSIGVLHHMHQPLVGLRSIVSLLRPGGFLLLGFYSRRARKSVNAARDLIAAEAIQATEPEIRKFRQRVFAADRASDLARLGDTTDFYAMSMCRDLLFHVQEHQYTLPQLGGMLRELDLECLGLAELKPDTLARYRKMFPADPLMNDLENWDVYEQQYPDTFSGMFLLWCQLTFRQDTAPPALA